VFQAWLKHISHGRKLHLGLPNRILTLEHPFETIYLKVILGAENLQAKVDAMIRQTLNGK
jgi:hypothetical protein